MGPFGYIAASCYLVNIKSKTVNGHLENLAEQAQLYFEKLTYLQNIMLSVELSDRLKDGKRENEISIIISALLNSKSKGADTRIVKEKA